MAREQKLPRPDDAEPGVDIPEEDDVDESATPDVAPEEEPTEPATPEEEEAPAEEEEEQKDDEAS